MKLCGSDAMGKPSAGRYGVGLSFAKERDGRLRENPSVPGGLSLRVETVVPAGPAAASQKIDIGDELIEVDGTILKM